MSVRANSKTDEQRAKTRPGGPFGRLAGMNKNQESPRLASVYMVVASMQFAAAAGRFLTMAVGSGWWFFLVLLVITALLFGIATGLQRILMPNRRTAFAFRYFIAGLAISLLGSIISLAT